MHRRIVVALTVSLVGAALALGPALAGSQKGAKAQSQAQKGTKTALKAQKQGGGQLGGKRMLQALNLSAEQQTRIKAIRADQKQRLVALKGDNSLTPEQRRTRLRSLRQETRASIEQVLTRRTHGKSQAAPRHAPPARDSRGPSAAGISPCVRSARVHPSATGPGSGSGSPAGLMIGLTEIE